MRRREFIAALGSAVLSPFGARAEQVERIRRIGDLSGAVSGDDPEAKRLLGGLAQELQKLGWVEGRNFQFEVRRPTAAGVITKDAAYDLVRSQPDVIVTPTTNGLRLLQEATQTIPIVFIGVSDPVGHGFVPSLARPGGNITGFASTEPAMVDKWYELLKAMAPQVTKVLLLFNPNAALQSLYLEPLKTKAPNFGLDAIPTPVQTTADIESALSRGKEGGVWGLVALPDSFMFNSRQLLADLAVRYRVPAVYPIRYHATSGGLISYGADLLDLWKRAASYVDRILKGEKPGELPGRRP